MIKNTIKRTLSMKLGHNINLNRKALHVKQGFDQVYDILQSETFTKKKKKK